MYFSSKFQYQEGGSRFDWSKNVFGYYYKNVPIVIIIIVHMISTRIP